MCVCVDVCVHLYKHFKGFSLISISIILGKKPDAFMSDFLMRPLVVMWTIILTKWGNEWMNDWARERTKERTNEWVLIILFMCFCNYLFVIRNCVKCTYINMHSCSCLIVSAFKWVNMYLNVCSYMLSYGCICICMYVLVTVVLLWHNIAVRCWR